VTASSMTQSIPMVRHVFETMGTVASLSVERMPAASLGRIESIFAQADQRFSLYRRDSELSRIATGSLALIDASTELLDCYAEAIEWRNATNGAFSPNRPDGVIDLNGIVKALAMREAGAVLDADGCNVWSLAVGGDILVAEPAGTTAGTTAGSTTDAGSTPWATGIVDPFDRGSLQCSVVLRGSRRAVATSGSAERGDHIWLGGGRTSAEFVQVSVVADDIVTADVLATAIISGGRESLNDSCARFSIDVLAIDPSGELLATPGFRAALAEA
jgi:thiamine biosynthesis lipoprotein